MRLAAMNAGVWSASTIGRAEEREVSRIVEGAVRPADRWNLERFAQEQIRGLVNKVFSQSSDRCIRQVVLSAIGPETGIADICRRIGETLANEDAGDVVIDTGHVSMAVYESGSTDPMNYADLRIESARQHAVRLRKNLWLMPPRCDGKERFNTSFLHLYLSDLRREFAYSIVAAPAAGESHEALAMAQFADGIILVLSAQHTRRIAARKVKDALAHVRLLGTVLCDREFPVPEGIYRRL